MIPRTKAPIRNLLFTTLRVNTTGLSDLQLNPWNRRAEHNVANAIVLPRGSLLP